ncbi:DNA-directed DNA polymerase [Tanacetum coccineum]
MILNEFAIKLLLDYEEKNGEKIMKKELLVALNEELYFVKFIINPEQYDVKRDDWEAILEGIDFGDIPQLDGIDVPPFFSDQHKKLLDSVMLDKLKLDGEVEIDKEEATKEVIRCYKTLREKNDPGVFVLPIRIKAKFDTHALADTGSNINVIPYRNYAKLGREEVKPVKKKITMMDHSKAEPMGILKDVLCQVGVTTILAKFLILNIPVDKDVPIVVGRSFLHTCGGIINTIKGTTSTLDDVCHQKFYVAARDKNGKPLYGPKFAKYLNCDDPMDRALALQEAINPFRKICVWKKMVAFLGSLPVPLQHMELIPNYSDNFIKKGNGDGQWHAKVRIVDPCVNVFDQGYKTKATKRDFSKFYKSSDIMLPDWF